MEYARYRQAVIGWIKFHPDAFGFRGFAPPIDIFFLVSESPVVSEDDYKALAAYNAQVLTYSGLIANAKNAYGEYLQAHSQTTRIDEILSKLSGMM